MRMNSLLNSTYLTGLRMPVIAYAPTDRGNGGGEDDQGDDDQEEDLNLDDESLDDVDDPLESDDDEISDDSDDFLAKLFKDEEGDDDDNSEDDDDEDAGDSEEDQAAMAEAIKTAIKGIAVPENAIPENFDPTDSKQLRDVLGAVQRQTVQETMRIMWTPISAALKQTIVRVRQETRATVNDRVTGNSLDSLVRKAIPIASQPAYKDVVESVLKTTRKRYPKDPERAVMATRKALKAMGINPMGKAGTQTANKTTGSRGVASGKSALDLFAPLPGSTSRRPADRVKRALKK